MNPRQRRLVADLNRMKDGSSLKQFSFEPEGNPPEGYEVEFEARGIALKEGRIIECTDHRCHIYLHRDYPRRPPVITWKTPVYHPNLLGPDRNGGVCIGAWSASESLVDLVNRLRNLVTYRSFSLEDALDNDAADWVRRESLSPGADLKEILGHKVVTTDEDALVVEVRNSHV